jgi:glycosyltransferase involved in cell wall biosynthesis
MPVRPRVTAGEPPRNLEPYEDVRVISVILTTYDRRALVSRALASVLAQAVGAGEVIVVDDGSTDGTVEDLRHQPVRLVRLPHSGNPAVARNAGLAKTTGDLIAFLDSDDVLKPDALADLSAALRERPDVGFAYGDYLPDPGPSPALPDAGDIFDQLLAVDFLVTGGVLFRRSLLSEVGTMDPLCSPAEDWDYWLRLAAHAHGVHVARPVIEIRTSPDSLSRASNGSIFAANIRVTRKALRWCLAHRPASIGLARRVYRQAVLASARHNWHRGSLVQTARDLAAVAYGR